MTQNALDVLTFIFAWGWRFLTGIRIPGTNVTPGAVLFFILLVDLSINFARRLSGVTPTSSPKERKSKGR